MCIRDRLKILLNEERPDAGGVRFGPTVKVGYLPQIVRFEPVSYTHLDVYKRQKKGGPCPENQIKQDQTKE